MKYICGILMRISDPTISYTAATIIVSDRYGFILVCVPKVASQSMLSTSKNIDPNVKVFRNKTLFDLYQQHPHMSHYFTFGFIRHPIDRLESCWKNKIATDPSGPQQLINMRIIYTYPESRKRATFVSFCRWICSESGGDDIAERHWISQHTFLTKPDGNLLDFIGKYENLDEDWRSALITAGAPHVDIHFMNASRVSRDSNDYPDYELLMKLRERYREDYQIWENL